MELALAVAADSTWPERVRRSALLLISVTCRNSTHAAQQFLQLEVKCTTDTSLENSTTLLSLQYCIGVAAA